jgi:hypothetical protein
MYFSEFAVEMLGKYLTKMPEKVSGYFSNGPFSAIFFFLCLSTKKCPNSANGQDSHSCELPGTLGLQKKKKISSFFYSAPLKISSQIQFTSFAITS